MFDIFMEFVAQMRIDSRRWILRLFHIPATFWFLFLLSRQDVWGMLHVWWLAAMLVFLAGWMLYDTYQLRQEYPESRFYRICQIVLPMIWLLKLLVAAISH